MQEENLSNLATCMLSQLARLENVIHLASTSDDRQMLSQFRLPNMQSIASLQHCLTCIVSEVTERLFLIFPVFVKMNNRLPQPPMFLKDNLQNHDWLVSRTECTPIGQWPYKGIRGLGHQICHSDFDPPYFSCLILKTDLTYQYKCQANSLETLN